MSKTLLHDKQVYLNYAQGVQGPAPVDLPTLIPDKALLALTKNDAQPLYRTESIPYPAKGTGGIYTEAFFESFLNVTRSRPIPGSKNGHTMEGHVRPSSDLYTVGGQLEKQGNGSGVAHLKIYVPQDGNADLIRDMEAGIVHFSLVTQPEYYKAPDENGVEQNYFVASKGYERNDAVEYNAGAMAQVVNSREIKETEETEVVTKETALEFLKINSGIPLSEIAHIMGQSDKLRNAAEIDGLTAKVKELEAELAKVDEARRNSKLNDAFGATGDLRDYAGKVLCSVALADLDAQIEATKQDPLALKLAAQSVDPYANAKREDSKPSEIKQYFNGLAVKEV